MELGCTGVKTHTCNQSLTNYYFLFARHQAAIPDWLKILSNLRYNHAQKYADVDNAGVPTGPTVLQFGFLIPEQYLGIRRLWQCAA